MKKIKHPLVKGVVKEIVPRIYCVTVDDDYDRAMLFCRYQEFYESPYKKFRGKPFTWMEYMRHYKSAWKKRTFTYPDDWAGYNIPSNILDGGVDAFYKETEYDVIMNDIYFYCAIDSQNKNDGTNAVVTPSNQKPYRLQTNDLLNIPLKEDLLIAIFDRPISPGNLGTVIRSCESFNVDAQIVGRVESFNGKKLTIESEFGKFEY